MEISSLENFFSLHPKRERRLRRLYWSILFLFFILLTFFWEPLRSTSFTYSLVSITIGSLPLEIFFRIITTLGSEGFFLVFFAIIYWSFDKVLGFWGLLIMPLSIFVTSEVPKDIIRLPRPDVRGVSVSTYTFPSGHTSGAVSVWGYLAVMKKRPWIWIWTLFIVSMVGLSRIMLGYHFPGDVLGGFIMGMAFLYLFFSSGVQLLKITHERVSNGIMLVLALFLPLGLSFLPVYFGARLMGYLAGAGVGYLLERSQLNFQPGGTLARNFVQIVIGLGVLAILTLGLDYFIGVEMHLLKFLQYALATYWITYLAPLLFYGLYRREV